MPIEQSLFDRLVTVLEQNGIPDNNRQTADIVQSVTGQDVYRHLTGDVVGFEDAGRVMDTYRDHRSSHRIAAFGEQVFRDDSWIYLGRQAQQQPSRWWPMIYDVSAQINRMHMNDMTPQLSNMPWIVSEEQRFDRNPMNNDVPEQHATLHLLHLPGMSDVDATGDLNGAHLRSMETTRLPEAEGNGVGSCYFRMEEYDALIADTVADLETEGWSLVKRNVTIRHGGENSVEELIIGAIAPEGVGRHAVMLLNLSHYAWAAMVAVEIMLDLYATLPEVTIEDPSDDSLTVISLCGQTRAAVQGIRQNIVQLRSTVDRRNRELDELLASVATNTRALTDERRQLNEMELGAERVALQSVVDLATIPEMMNSMRQIQSADIVTEGDSMYLELLTYPFGMRVPAGRYRTGREDGLGAEEDGTSSLYVVPIIIKINLMARSWSEAITLRAQDGGGRFHPHVSQESYPCWGRAATPMAEAWGRRDWESFVRLLLGWVTQYDANDIYTYIHTIIDVRGMAPRTGWLVPEEGEPIPGPIFDRNEQQIEEDEMEHDEEGEPLRFVEL